MHKKFEKSKKFLGMWYDAIFEGKNFFYPKSGTLASDRPRKEFLYRVEFISKINQK